MTGISQEVGNFSEQVWGVPMSVVKPTSSYTKSPDSSVVNDRDEFHDRHTLSLFAVECCDCRAVCRDPQALRRGPVALCAPGATRQPVAKGRKRGHTSEHE
jgi:hypothetical protein